jgi:polyphosphate glucokinase
VARVTKNAPVPEETPPPSKVLVVDIGGTKVKLLASGQTEPRKVTSGKRMTPTRMVEAVREQTGDWEYEAISIGYPGLVGATGPRAEPGNLGPGWVGYDYAAAFNKPVRILNDAAMQALGSYDGGRMLFLGFGTGLGSTLIADHVIVPLELGRVRKNGSTLGELLGRAGMTKMGKNEWRALAESVVTWMMESFIADYIVVGGGNAKTLKELPPGVRRGHNLTAFRGGFRMWHLDDVATLSTENAHAEIAAKPRDWRMV